MNNDIQSLVGDKEAKARIQRIIDNTLNSFEPKSPEWLFSQYTGLRPADKERDPKYSALHDSIMSAIASNLKEYAPDAFDKVWSRSLFPERLTKEILRLCEQQISITFSHLIKKYQL